MSSPASRHLVVVGGGSAGHVLPAVPVMQHLAEHNWRVSFVGTRGTLEKELIEPLGFDYYGIAAGKLRRYWSWQNVTDVFRIFLGVLQSFRLLRRLRPDVVFAKGGFVSFPLALAAWLRRIPVVAHESDITPGLANRLLMPLVQTLCVSFPSTESHRRGLRKIHAGTPIRAQILQGDAGRGRKLTGLAEDKPLIVITGGSLGASSLNEAVIDNLSILLEHFYVFHVCGEGKVAQPAQPGYQPVAFVGEGWGDILAAADLIVSRAGANALFEILALAKPNLLIPLPASVSRGDQLLNAAYAAEQGFSLVLDDAHLQSPQLAEAVQLAWRQREDQRARMQAASWPDAVAVISAEIERCLMDAEH